MKKFLVLFLAGFAIFFISCGEESANSKTCNPVCESWQTCDNGECKLVAGKCKSDNDCKSDASKPICDITKHVCIEDNTPECTVDADCTDAAKPKCDNGVCIEDNTSECTVDTDCTDAAKPKCDNGVCIEDNTPECTVDTDCTDAAKPKCDNGVCIEDNTPECTVDADCTDAAKPKCDNGVCIEDNTSECTVDADCTDAAKPKCDNGICIEDNTPECIGLSFDRMYQNEYYVNVYGAFNGNYLLVTGFFRELSPVGVYDLSSALNSNYETCQQCVKVLEYNENNEVDKVYFQKSGTLEVTKNDGTFPESAGNITTVKLIEVTIDDQGDNPTYHSTPVEGGTCIEIQTGSWDSTLCNTGDTRCSFDGSRSEFCDSNNTWQESLSCSGATSCEENERNNTLTCEADIEIGSECNDFSTCKNNGACLGFENQPQHCYDICSIESNASTECPGNKACIKISDNLLYCESNTVPAQEIDEPCSAVNRCSDPDSYCIRYTNGESYCRKKCTAASDNSNECNGKACYAFNDNTGFFCDVMTETHDKILGEECSFLRGELCADNNLCLGYSNEPHYCLKRCSAVDTDGDTECPGNADCNDLGNGDFYCSPIPNEVAMIGEKCDHIGNACNSAEAWCLGRENEESHCFKKCTVAAQNSSECDGRACYSFGSNNEFYCAPAKTQYRGEECNLAKQCVDGNSCIKARNGKSYCYKTCSVESLSSPECDGWACYNWGDNQLACLE